MTSFKVKKHESCISFQVNRASVVAVGPGRRNLTNGELIPVSVKEGEVVLLPEYGGQNIKLDSQE